MDIFLYICNCTTSYKDANEKKSNPETFSEFPTFHAVVQETSQEYGAL